MASFSFYWHDYETFGIDPRRDRPSQFAGVRTDADFNVIDDPLVLFCKPPADYLPQPESCLITGITPQVAEAKGVNEAEFIRKIHEQFSEPNTCGLGYNSIRFDDEFTRNCLYRNFYDPYAREWQNGNSRWDLIDVVRAMRALRPDGINWPTDAEGNPSLKLEDLSKVNGIAHEDAHDALSDVYATIGLAKLVKQAQPKLFDYLWQHRTKQEAFALLNFGSYQPVVHVSGRYPSLKHNLAVVLPIGKHPINNNGILVYDLSIDPEPLLSLNAEEIQQRIFTATADLPEGVERIPIKTVHLNKSPVIAPISVLKPEDQQRLNLDLAICHNNINKIKAVSALPEKLTAVFTKPFKEEDLTADPDLAIYSGGFFPQADKQRIAKIGSATPEQLAQIKPNFTDARLPELLFRCRARNFPDTLSETERQSWLSHCRQRLTDNGQAATMTFGQFFAEIERLRTHTDADAKVLRDLENYARQRMAELGLIL